MCWGPRGYYYYDYVVIGVLRPSWLLLLRLCSNRCVEALVAFRNSLLNRWNVVHGGKILTIIIIIFLPKLFVSQQIDIRRNIMFMYTLVLYTVIVKINIYALKLWFQYQWILQNRVSEQVSLVNSIFPSQFYRISKLVLGQVSL